MQDHPGQSEISINLEIYHYNNQDGYIQIYRSRRLIQYSVAFRFITSIKLAFRINQCDIDQLEARYHKLYGCDIHLLMFDPHDER